MLLTIVLKHDQSKNIFAIRDQLEQQDFIKKFPPAGAEVVSWYVMMGLGQVVTLRFEEEMLRSVNRAIEESAWGAFRTEIYATYDFAPIAGAQRKPAQEAGSNETETVQKGK